MSLIGWKVSCTQCVLTLSSLKKKMCYVLVCEYEIKRYFSIYKYMYFARCLHVIIFNLNHGHGLP
jgi:hypothetical protein